MRILRLDLGAAQGTIDFHPFISVVHGLEQTQRDVLVDALRSISRGTLDEMSGLVENEGRLIELATTDGEVLGPFTTEDVIMAVDTAELGDEDEVTLRAELDQLERRAESDAVHVEEVRADLDPTALALVQNLRRQLAGTTPVTAAELEQANQRQGVQDAIDSLARIEPVLYESRPEVVGIVERWNEFVATQGDATGHLARLSRKVKDAESALARANEAQAEAQQLAVPLTLTAQEDARVEELAAITFDRRGRRAKKRSAEEELELDTLLGKVGQPTHAAYAMYRLAPQADPAGVAAVERACQLVERAQGNVDATRAEESCDPLAVELAGQLGLLKDEARLHLGPMLPKDLGAALLALRDESENPEWIASVGELYDGLVAAGAEIDESVDPGDLSGWAAGWLNSQVEADAAKRDAVDRNELSLRLERAEASLDRHARAMGRIDRLEAAAAISEGYASDLHDRLAIAQGDGGLSATDLLSSIEPLADLVRTEAGSSAPVVLVGDFNTLGDSELQELLGSLEDLARGVQLIVMTDRSAAAEWAGEAGLRRALPSTLMTSPI